MDTMKVKQNNVPMIAHRGLSGLEPENSIPAFIAAGNRSYFGIETDVHVTADGKFVVIHDEQTGRVAEDDINVEQCSYNLVRKIKLHNISNVERSCGVTTEDVTHRSDLIIPNLEEYVSICKKYGKKCVLELKNRFQPEDIRRLLAEIRNLEYLEDVIFISFSFENMVYLRQLLPEQELQYLISKYDQEVLERLNKYHLELDVYHKVLTEEVIAEIHANGHKVNCWTVDSVERAEQLIAWGVDYITTNILE